MTVTTSLPPRLVQPPRPPRFRGVAPPRAARAERHEFEHVSDEALHAQVKTLAGRYNGLTAELLAHLGEVDARGIYRERACSSLYTYCVYELRLSEDEAQRRTRAARTARTFPVLFEMLAEGAIHLTGLLLLAPYLTADNHAELLARARFRTKREIEHLVAELAPRPDVPARIEPLGPRGAAAANSWQAYTASLRGPVRDLVPGVGAGDGPPDVGADSCADACDGTGDGPPDVADSCDGAGDADATESFAPARVEDQASVAVSKPLGPLRYRVEFTASERYVALLEEARNLLQHQMPERDVARVHELAMAAFVEQLRKRRQAASERPRRVAGSEASAPARGTDARDGGSAPARVDGADSESEGAAPAQVTGARDGSAPAPVAARRNRPLGGERRRESGEADGACGRHVPAEIRRAVWRRDAGCCTFEDSSGRRCCERAGLELHHEHAFARGGPTTLENLRLMCRAHNALLAERDFGRAYIERMKRARRDGLPEG